MHAWVRIKKLFIIIPISAVYLHWRQALGPRAKLRKLTLDTGTHTQLLEVCLRHRIKFASYSMLQILTFFNTDYDIGPGCRDRIDMPYSVLSLIMLKWTPDYLTVLFRSTLQKCEKLEKMQYDSQCTKIYDSKCTKRPNSKYPRGWLNHLETFENEAKVVSYEKDIRGMGME